MRLLPILGFTALTTSTPLLTHPPKQSATSNIKCPIVFDGRVSSSASLTSFDSATTSPYNPSYVKGENTSWSSILLLPPLSPSRFDIPHIHKPVEVTIDNRSLFRAGSSLQTGFRRAGLLLKDDANDPSADSADSGIVTFHWSVAQDRARPLNLSHEYMNVWHERGDYAGNQFSFVGGVVLVGDGGTGVDTKRERETWKVQNRENGFIFKTPILWRTWQNFAVRLNYVDDTIQVWYSAGYAPLKAVTALLPNDNAGGGQLQWGIAKKPTETQTVVYDGYQESIAMRGEGQIYGGVFVEDSSGGCVSV